MTHWNYRLLFEPDHVPMAHIVEAFYDDKGALWGYSEPFEQDLDHDAYAEAIRQPVITDADCVGVGPSVDLDDCLTLDEAVAAGFITDIK